MKETYLSRLIQTVNASNFVNYFDLFAKNYLYRSNKELIHSFSAEDWKDSSKSNIASTGKRIFRESLEIEALEFISNNCELEIASKAKSILERYNPCVDNKDTLLNKIISKINDADFSPIKSCSTYKKENINKLQRNILDSLKTISPHFSEEYQMSKNSKDKADIYGEIDDCCIIIELDTTRADQVAKKFVSRTALNLDKKIIYIAICYPRKDTTPLQELKKYFVYCRSILLNIDKESSFTGLIIDSKRIKEIV